MRLPLICIALLCASPALAQHDTRDHLRDHHGGQTYTYVEFERLEFQTGEGDPFLLWDAQGWYGGDKNKLWLKTEGEFELNNGDFEDAEVQALWSRAIGGFFDAQAGIRHDFAPGDDRTFGVVGLQGLTPYLFEIDAAAFISGEGDVSARLEAEYELLITQNLILQPRTELNFAVQSVPEYAIGSGLSTAELGARLRYQFSPSFAPYIGVSWERDVGETADFTRAVGEDPTEVSFIAGLRSWF